MPIVFRYLADFYTINQVSLILTGLIANLLIASLLFEEKQKTKSKNGTYVKEKSKKFIEILTLPLFIYLCAHFLINCGKYAQYPYFTPFAISIGLTGYEPAMILVILNVGDILTRSLGGWLAGRKIVLKYGQSVFVAFFLFMTGMMNLSSSFLISGGGFSHL